MLDEKTLFSRIDPSLAAATAKKCATLAQGPLPTAIQPHSPKLPALSLQNARESTCTLAAKNQPTHGGDGSKVAAHRSHTRSPLARTTSTAARIRTPSSATRKPPSAARSSSDAVGSYDAGAQRCPTRTLIAPTAQTPDAQKRGTNQAPRRAAGERERTSVVKFGAATAWRVLVRFQMRRVDGVLVG